MGKGSQKSKKRKTNTGMWAFCLLCLILALVTIMLVQWSYSATKQNQEADALIQVLREEKSRLEEANTELSLEIERLHSPAYIEQLAREKLGLVHKGEILVAPRED
jgi:cell division protein FtsL